MPLPSPPWGLSRRPSNRRRDTLSPCAPANIVPLQLVGTGTSAAAAAAGLVFGQPPDSDTPPQTSRRKPFPFERDTARSSVASSRPASSAVSPYPSLAEDLSWTASDDSPGAQSGTLSSPPPGYYPPNSSRAARSFTTQVPPLRERRTGLLRQGDSPSGREAEAPSRDSVSSRDSWLRRLSIRPLSQHGSIRSSMGPESPSIAISHGSAAPFADAAPHALHSTPNKLVKRAHSGQQNTNQGALSQKTSRTQVLTLRRPATSHQRSATLQQFQNQGGFSGPPLPPPQRNKYSFDQQHSSRREFVPRPMIEVPDPESAPGTWTSFFHTTPGMRIGRRTSGSVSDGSPNTATLPRRVALKLTRVPRPYLTKAHWITGAKPKASMDQVKAAEPEPTMAGSREPSPPQAASDPSNSTDSTPSKRARKSISMHFSSPTSWISRTGSMRRPRRGTMDSKSGGPRHVSAPLGASPRAAQPEPKPTLEEIFTPPQPREQSPRPELKTGARPQPRKRNSSSPLPPISRISSFNLDVARLGTSGSSPTSQWRPAQSPASYMSGQSPHGTLPRSPLGPLPRSRGPSGERASTLASSDAEARDGVSNDDEDTDFRSDGVFDSFRTVASSSRVRAVETPLESMFDESPPSTASNTKTKRLSIQEILGRSWDGETKITEEDESSPTPIRTVHLADPIEFDRQSDSDHDDFDFGDSAQLSVPNRDFGRLSLDEDDDDDWTRDDDFPLSNHLSPPSSSTNSRRVSPTLRHALKNIDGNTGPEPHRDLAGDRPRSNIFDWCEPATLDKHDADGTSPRPKTVHGKQEMDLRGGRSVNRKGPSAAHVRSQSVPAVPDPTEATKPQQPKFGTWGLGSKTASEEWDDDFDFDETLPEAKGGKDSVSSFSMVVPASIQATQPTVKAHSGQIRELSLLVNDLKRLHRHGKDLNILHGPTAAKWKEAENIIALASPDEDANEDDDATPSAEVDVAQVEDRFVDEGFDAAALDRMEDPFEVPEPEMGKTTVVRSRPTTRRRSVFSPDDEIFGNNWPLHDESVKSTRPHTPENAPPPNPSAVIANVIEVMQQQRSISDPVKSRSPRKPSNSKLFFDTNSLQELVKRAGHLRDSLSDAVRRAELLTQSPAGTPRRERHPRHNADGSPAFTRVFTDPASSPPRRIPQSHSTNSVLSRTSVDSPRMQMMTVN